MEFKTKEEALELAKDYAMHYLIKQYLETKDKNILEEIEKIMKHSGPIIKKIILDSESNEKEENSCGERENVLESKSKEIKKKSLF